MLMPASASASNMSAAIPGCVFMPAPTTETFATSMSVATAVAPTSAATAPRIGSALPRSVIGTVNEMSERPATDTFWTIMSMLTPASASGRNTRAATPGWSGTPEIVTFASDTSCATPEMIAFSIKSSSLLTHVPSAPVNDERTWTTTPWLRANSTERGISTPAPEVASSSISSYDSSASFLATGTSLGSAVKTPSTSV